jgi:hypothetical protein
VRSPEEQPEVGGLMFEPADEKIFHAHQKSISIARISKTFV